MNAMLPVDGVTRRVADLGDPAVRAALDAFVRAEPGAEPFHLPAWSLAVEQGCRQKAHYLVAESVSGKIEGVLPLSEIRSPLFGSALVSAGFGVGGGILARSEGVAELLAADALALAYGLGCASVELRGGHLPSGWSRAGGLYAGFARDLPGDEEAILASIPRKQRAEVRRATGHDLGVAVGHDLQTHYEVYAESVRNLGTPVFPRSLFRAMFEAFGAEADILTISRGGRPLASVLSFYFNGTVHPYWGGGTAEARAWRANDLLYYELMRHAVRRGMTRFDFGRSKLGTGAFAFKKNWGFEPAPLVYAARPVGDAPLREINPLSPRYRLQVAAWKKLPLWLANRLGPPIARGLG